MLKALYFVPIPVLTKRSCRVVNNISNRFLWEVIFAAITLKLWLKVFRFQSTSTLAILNNKGQEIVSMPKINIVLDHYFWKCSTDPSKKANRVLTVPVKQCLDL